MAGLLAHAVLAHTEHPMVFLAVVTTVAASDCNEDVPEDGAERELLEAFLGAAADYAKAVTDRWDAESDAELEQQSGSLGSEGCPGCECEQCKPDERQRLLDEELKAAARGGDMSRREEEGQR